MVATLIQELRFACRRLRNRRSIVWVGALALALAVAGQLVALAMLRAATRWTLPYGDAGSLVRVHEAAAEGRRDVSPDLFQSLAHLPASPFRHFGCAHPIAAEIGESAFRKVSGLAVTQGFELATTAIATGTPAIESRGDGAAVSSRLARELGLTVGSTIVLDRRLARVTGVLREGFRFPEYSRTEADVVVALEGDRLASDRATYCVARLTGSVRQAEIALSAASLERHVRLEPLASGPPLEVARWPKLAALTMSLLSLLACVNGVGLLLGSQLLRIRELALRSMIGASPARVVLPFLSEVFLFLMSALGVGVLIAWLGQRFLERAIVSHVALVGDPGITTGDLGLTAAVVVAGMTVACAVPALRIRSQDPLALVRPTAGRSSWTGAVLRHGYSVAQIALAFVFLSSATMLGLSVRKAAAADIGLGHRSGVFVDFSPAAGRETLFERREQILREVRERPDVRYAAAVFGGRPYGGGTSYVMARVPGRIELKNRMRLRLRMVSSEFFEAVGLPIEQGRPFVATDDRPDGPRVAIINNHARRLLYPSEASAIGELIVIDGPRRIVAVVGDAKLRSAELDAEPEVYVPLFQSPVPITSLAILPNPSESPIVEPLRNGLKRRFPELEITRGVRLADELDARLAPRRLGLWTVACAALLANILCLVGLVASVRMALEARSREVSIRLAVGGTRAGIMWLLTRHNVAIVLCGLALGATAWIWCRTWVEGHMVGLDVPAGLSLAASASLIFALGLAAGLATAARLVRRQLGGLVRTLG